MVSTYQNLSSLRACEYVVCGNGECENRLVMLHAVGEGGHVAGERGGHLVSVSGVHCGVMVGELCHQRISLLRARSHSRVLYTVGGHGGHDGAQDVQA